jgi:hypothetical protein
MGGPPIFAAATRNETQENERQDQPTDSCGDLRLAWFWEKNWVLSCFSFPSNGSAIRTNTLIYSPGHYKFTDFTKVGIWLNLIFLAIAR